METALRVFLVAIMVIAAFFVGATVGQQTEFDGIGGIFESDDRRSRARRRST